VRPEDVIEVLETLDRRGIHVWIDGGWGVDALIGKQTREHLDLELAVDQRELSRINATFLTTAPGTSAKDDGSEQLTGTVRLPQGQISVLGTVGAYARVAHVAIVGGTGRYAGARGDVTALFTPRAVKLHVAFV
jgi:aminoglycoside-2''-adenylyltransferase